MQLGTITEDMAGIKAPMFDGTQPCATVEDLDIFFPELDDPLFKQKQAQAKSICAECAFKLPCLEYALKTQQLGIWGGATFSERKRIRASRKRKPPG